MQRRRQVVGDDDAVAGQAFAQPGGLPDSRGDPGVVAVEIFGPAALQKRIQRPSQARQHFVRADEIHQPQHRRAAGVGGADRAGHGIGQQAALLARGPDVVAEIREGEIPPLQVPQVFARRVRAGRQPQRRKGFGAGHGFQRQVAAHRQRFGRPRLRQRPAARAGAAQAVIVAQALGLPAQEMVQLAGVFADVVAGQHLRAQQPGQRVHQFKADAVVPPGGYPDGHPDVRAGALRGGDIPGCAQQAPVRFGHRKVRRAAVPGKIIFIQLRPVQKRQAHVKMFVDERRDGRPLAGARQAEDRLRQWRTPL